MGFKKNLSTTVLKFLMIVFISGLELIAGGISGICATSGDSSAVATLSQDLKMQIPFVRYKGADGDILFSVDLEFSQQEDGLLFELVNCKVLSADSIDPNMADSIDNNLQLHIKKLEFISADRSIFLELDLDFVNIGSRYFFKVGNYTILESAEEPDNNFTEDGGLKIDFSGESIDTYPLIKDTRLFVLTRKSTTEYRDFSIPGYPLTDVPVANNILYLYCFDISNSFNLLWKKEVANYSFDTQVNLIALQERIAVTTSYKYGDYMGDDQRRITFFDPVTGDITLQTEDLNEWSFTKPSGKTGTYKTGSNHSNGILLEINGELLFGETGFGVSLCSGKLAHTELKGHWKLSTIDPLVSGSSLMLFDSTSAISAPYDFFSLDLQTKIAEIKGYKTDSTIFKIAFTEDDIASVSKPVTNGESIFFIYVKNDNKLYLGEYSAKNGVKISETALLPDKNYRGYSCYYDQLVLSGDNLLIPSGTTLPEADPLYPPQIGQMIYDIKTKQIKYSTAKGFVFNPLAVMTGENLFYLQQNGSGNLYIEQVNLESGAEVREIHSEVLNSVSSNILNNFELFSGMILHDQGYLILKGGNPLITDDDFLIVQYTGDMSEGKKQYKYNNQGNPWIETKTAADVGAADEEGSGEADQGADAALSSTDLSEDTQTGSELIYKDIVDIDSLYSAYVPLLKKVSFNTDGETGGVGEGALIVRGSISCPEGGNCCPGEFSSKLYYPYKSYLPLDDRKVVEDSGETQPLLTFYPRIPIYYTLWESLENDEERKTMFSYQAYEHDTQDAFDSIADNMGDLVSLGVAILTGDICGMVTSVLDMGESALTSVDENYGSPFVYLKRNSGVQGSIFGVPQGSDTTSLTIGASDKPGEMQTAVGFASDTADLVCGAIDIYGAVADPDTYQNMAVSLTSFGPNISGRATQGDIEFNRKLLLPVSSLKITLDRIENSMSWPITDLYLRAGVVGEDFASTVSDKAADTDKTPFVSYLKWSQSSDSGFTGFREDVDLVLYDGKFNINSGLAGVYTEVGLMNNLIYVSRYLGVYSDTKFFQDLLYGGWEQDGQDKLKFTKSVKKRVESPYGEAYLYLTYAIALGSF